MMSTGGGGWGELPFYQLKPRGRGGGKPLKFSMYYWSPYYELND